MNPSCNMKVYPNSGTKIRFNPPISTDIIWKGGLMTYISIRLQNITIMKEYENKSAEELRLEDYILNNVNNVTAAFMNVENFSYPTSQNAIKKVSPSQIDASTQTEEELCKNCVYRVGKLPQGLKDILLRNKHSDFVINVNGTEFRVHKIILAAYSPVFAAMMEHDTREKATGIADIHDFEAITFWHFLYFLYTGKVENFNLDNVLDLYTVADKYQVTELTSFCEEYMMNNISVDSFCDILSISLRHNLKELTELATQFFLKNSKAILLTSKWMTFITENPITGNELFLKVLNLAEE